MPTFAIIMCIIQFHSLFFYFFVLDQWCNLRNIYRTKSQTEGIKQIIGDDDFKCSEDLAWFL